MTEAVDSGMRDVFCFGGLAGSAVLVPINAVEDVQHGIGSKEAEGATENDLQY